MSKPMNPYAAFFNPFYADPFAFFYGPRGPQAAFFAPPRHPGCRGHEGRARFGEPWDFCPEPNPEGKRLEGPGKDGKCECAHDDPKKMALAQPPKPQKPRSERMRMKSGLLRTDVKESEEAYELFVNLPGFKKDDVKVQLKDGYLSISAESSEESEEKDQEGAFIRKERYHGSCSRSFYIGDEIIEDGIRAKFDNGVLQIELPKDQKALEEKAPAEIAID